MVTLRAVPVGEGIGGRCSVFARWVFLFGTPVIRSLYTPFQAGLLNCIMYIYGGRSGEARKGR